MTREQKVFTESKKANICGLMTGQEDFDGLMRLFFTPQGIEFCTKHNLPTIDTLRLFRGMQAARGGFYIDAPAKLKNPGNVALFGKTVAELEYDDTGVYHQVIVMHGAKAKITASGYAVVFVTNAGGEVETVINDNAKTLIL
ncbi:MAG: hypothetical protein LBT50_06520 [Prevotellaceae bacterium]|jgi:hypothetical protein|nr:hypothetical protein [Prevotellaceae bacterium]